jgi:hypothetical protein
MTFANFHAFGKTPVEKEIFIILAKDWEIPSALNLSKWLPTPSTPHALEMSIPFNKLLTSVTVVVILEINLVLVMSGSGGSTTLSLSNLH